MENKLRYFSVVVTLCFSWCFYGCSSKSNNCQTNDMCNDHGTCFVDTGLCSCDEGYAGDKCQTCSSAYKDYGDKLCKPVDPCAKDQKCTNLARNCSNGNGEAVCGSCIAGATEINDYCYTVDIPVITGIDGGGTAAAVVDFSDATSGIQDKQLANHRFQDSWIVSGNYLNNITSVELHQVGGDKVFNSGNGLTFEKGDTNMTGKILLPTVFAIGAFTLVFNSLGGQASAQVYVLQGEKGDPGPKGDPGAKGDTGAFPGTVYLFEGDNGLVSCDVFCANIDGTWNGGTQSGTCIGALLHIHSSSAISSYNNKYYSCYDAPNTSLAGWSAVLDRIVCHCIIFP